jgi:membrane-associated phospholipid phosphatase/tRNA A-37 threonylcarbamoyl transferase component Bud32
MEVRVAGIKVAGRRRRPTGESPPLPIKLQTSGWIWFGLGVLGLLLWGSLFWWPETTQWWEARDTTVNQWFVDLRRGFLTDLSQAIHALGSPWFWRPLRWLTLLVLAFVARRWRHFFGVILAIVIVGVVVDWVVVEVARPRPFVPIIGTWHGYSHPSVPIADLAVTLAAAGLALIPPGRWRLRFMILAAGVVGALVTARVYLGVDHLTDGVVSAMVAPAITIVVFRLWAPESVFPVTYRRGRTAHLDVGGSRGRAIVSAISDQLGIAITDVRPVGLEGSGGSTPLRLTVAGDPATYLFAKLYARSHLRADRWYKIGRTILYGALEDEVSFRTVRRLVEYEDYMFLTMWKSNIPSAQPFGIVEITPDREYLIVTEFLHDAAEISDVELDERLIDDALMIIRRLWDEGLAHRDIKPANVMVAEGRVRLIDVAFGTIRPTPWRQAVDLANMMLVLSLHAPPQLVYERALQFFAPEDIAEAFAATRGITVPSQLAAQVKARHRQDGVDLIETLRNLAPEAEPISMQRLSTRRVALTVGALLGGLILLGILIENIQGRGFL